MTALLDVNLLVALAWRNHVHHGDALSWFRGRGGRPWATTPFTEAGFVRVSSNASAIEEAVAPAEAIELLARIRSLEGHRFLADDVGLVLGERLDARRIRGHREVSDGHLLALAQRHEAKLATLDRAITALAGGGESVILVPIRGADA